jgi:polyhydroxyalkanoate synthesis regulator protein
MQIKKYSRYPNRKIYSTADTAYVKSAELLKEYRSNAKQVIVLDSKTKQDITQIAVVHALFKEADENPELVKKLASLIEVGVL